MKIQELKVCVNTLESPERDEVLNTVAAKTEKIKKMKFCNEVVPHETETCPVCTGRVFHPLSSWVPSHNDDISLEDLTRRSLSISDQVCEMQQQAAFQDIKEESVGV